ncbi:MAG: peptidase Ste24p [Acidobacteria bacterium]|nr:peptidase Ste24p [Acidobacteriota bacterium]
MRNIVIAAFACTLTAGAAHAQWGDILRKLDPNKVKAGAKVLQQSTREFTEDEEADIGRMVSARILKTYPLSSNEKQQRYVTLVGNTVAAYSARPTLEWHFAVLDSPIVNAFSAPGGFIFITTGSLKQIASEAELASVLGHEIAHATQKHILKEIKRANVISSAKDLAVATSSGADWLNNDLGRRIGDLAYEKLFTTGLSRRDELEADKIGAELADAAGYNNASFITFLESLKKLAGSSEMRQLTATHPAPPTASRPSNRRSPITANCWRNDS